MSRNEENIRLQNLAKLKQRLAEHNATISSVERRIDKRKRHVNYIDSLVKEKKIAESKIIKAKKDSSNIIKGSKKDLKTEQEKLREIKEKIRRLEKDIKDGKIERIKKQNKKDNLAQVQLERTRIKMEIERRNQPAPRKELPIRSRKELPIRSQEIGRDRSTRAERLNKIRKGRGKDYRAPLRSYNREIMSDVIPDSLIPISLTYPDKKETNFKDSFCFILNKDWEYKIITSNGWINKFKKVDKLISIASNDKVEFKQTDVCDIYIDIDDILSDYSDIEYGIEIKDDDKDKIKNICGEFLADNTVYIYSDSRWKTIRDLSDIIEEKK